MADFRKWILVLAVLSLFAGLAGAQSQTPFSCNAQAAVPPQLRAEGLTELVGDIVLTCTGGTPLAQGAQIPTANVTVYLNGTVTSRLLGTASVTGASEALLLVDDPGNGGTNYGNSVPQNICGGSAGFPLQGAGLNGCTEWVGNTTIGGTGVPVNTNPNTGAGGTFNAATLTYAANIFQGVVSGGSVTFYGIPVQPPATSGAIRSYRITNIRLNANGITGGGSIPANAIAAIAISGSTSIPVTNSNLTVGFISQSLNVSQSKAFSTSTTSFASYIALNQCQSYPVSGTTPVALETLRFQEAQGSAFKVRGTTTQNVPGQIYSAESGFTFTGLQTQSSATNTLYTAGYADWGTRLKAVFTNIPSGVALFVSVNNLNTAATDNAPMTALVANSSFAQLIVSETSPDNGTQPPIVSQTGTTTASTLAGPAPAAAAAAFGFAPLTIVAGSASAVWEVTNSLPNSPENFDFEVFMTVVSNTATSTPPAPSTMNVNMSYAPIPTQGAFTLAAGAAASSTLGIPRFADTSTAKAALSFAICQTALLFPYVTEIGGFDTGLAVANTTTDPFGTAAQTGSCSIYWYGTAPPATNPGFLGSAGYQTTAPTTTQLIASGTIQAWATSVAAPGFNGYVIALCNFQYAHGFAFVSDLGARNLAMGYLADVIGGPVGSGRNIGAPAEVSGQ
jgi:hypothetical protein